MHLSGTLAQGAVWNPRELQRHEQTLFTRLYLMAMMETKRVNTCALPLRAGALFVAARMLGIDHRGSPVAISALPQTLPPDA
jgi:hypothetical protein